MSGVCTYPANLGEMVRTVQRVKKASFPMEKVKADLVARAAKKSAPPQSKARKPYQGTAAVKRWQQAGPQQ
jgi:hypothetical protein